MRPHEQSQRVQLWLAIDSMVKWSALPDEVILSETKTIVKEFGNDHGQVYSCVSVNALSGEGYRG